MSLSDLLAGSHSPAHEEPVGSSGLGSLVRPAVTTVVQPPAARMNLVQALNALRRGEIERPRDDDGLSGMVMEELPLKKPAPAERTVDWSKWKKEMEEIKAEIAVQSAIDHAEMRHRIAARRGTSIDAAEQWMMENSNG